MCTCACCGWIDCVASRAKMKARPMIDATAIPWRRSTHRLAVGERSGLTYGLGSGVRSDSPVGAASIADDPATIAAPSSVKPGPSSTTVSARRSNSGASDARLAANSTMLVGGETRRIWAITDGSWSSASFSCRTTRSGRCCWTCSKTSAIVAASPTTKSPRSSRRNRARLRSRGRRSATIAVRRDGFLAMPRLQLDHGPPHPCIAHPRASTGYPSRSGAQYRPNACSWIAHRRHYPFLCRSSG